MRKKRKPTKAEAAAEVAFAAMDDKWKNAPKFAFRSHPVEPARRRTDEEIRADLFQPSTMKVGKADVGSTAPRKSIMYTGNEMLGIGAMHKSNEVPVFSKEAAVEIARMRRG